MKIINTKIPGLKILKSKNFYDTRGYFIENLKKKLLKKKFYFWLLIKVKKKCFERIAFANKIFTIKIYYCFKRKNI